MKKPVYLYGFMGSGKSYWGRKAASDLRLRFVDLDEYIAEHEHMQIPEIFAVKGEKYFRSLELTALKTVHADIISLGGGALLSPEAAAYAKNNAVVVLIDTPFETCYERVKSDGADLRPNAAGKSFEELHALYKSRETHYRNIADCIATNENTLKLIKELTL
ncbi:MAG: shikimate kinase [Oscillospiraceae bacterium]|nr:shikimate kinase [Oscillospiraceae bacterium]